MQHMPEEMAPTVVLRNQQKVATRSLNQRKAGWWQDRELCKKWCGEGTGDARAAAAEDSESTHSYRRLRVLGSAEEAAD